MEPAETVVAPLSGVSMINVGEEVVGLIPIDELVPVVLRLVCPAFSKFKIGAASEILVLEATVCPLLTCIVVLVAAEFMSSETVAAAPAVFKFSVLLPPPFGENVKL